MKKIKFICILNLIRVFQSFIKLFFRSRGTNLPGDIALKLIPDFISYLKLPNKVIGVTGTNGKTSTSNMINDILIDNGYKTVNNSKGSNLIEGIVSSLIWSSNIFGVIKKDVAILEIDERASRFVFNYIKPNYLVCTNLFRDSIKRNGHSEFILGKLKEKLPKETLLVLNADDLISSQLSKENDSVFFSVIGEKNNFKDIVMDIRLCPVCNNKLIYNYRHYHHIGSAQCSKCKFKSPIANFVVKRIDYENKLFIVCENSNEYVYNLLSNSIYNIYNMIAVISVLRVYGLSHEKIYNSFKKVNLKKDRIDRITTNNKEIITMLSKNQNPISCSRAFEFIKNETGSKIVILLITDSKDKKHKSEDISWIYDTDFEYLIDPHINKIIVAGNRYLDMTTRLLLAGIDKNKIIGVKKYIDVSKSVIFNCDKVIILYELYAYNIAKKIKNILRKKM